MEWKLCGNWWLRPVAADPLPPPRISLSGCSTPRRSNYPCPPNEKSCRLRTNTTHIIRPIIRWRAFLCFFVFLFVLRVCFFPNLSLKLQRATRMHHKLKASTSKSKAQHAEPAFYGTCAQSLESPLCWQATHAKIQETCALIG